MTIGNLLLARSTFNGPTCGAIYFQRRRRRDIDVEATSSSTSMSAAAAAAGAGEQQSHQVGWLEKIIGRFGRFGSKWFRVFLAF